MERHIFKGLPIYDKEAFNDLNKHYDENKSHILAALPWFVSELIEGVGFKEAIEFVYNNGGKRIFLGKTSEHLSKRTGLKISNVLFERILKQTDGSNCVDIPCPWGVSERIRWAMILCATMEGVPRDQIRDNFGISRRSLANLYRNPKKFSSPKDTKKGVTESHP
ncbi:MAG: hypothetical protein COB59_10545 [Rhodospirillaceae bacterium]|nr:MAG: hypothetical protein COB59_10545 [Rhodospirillaceae bacterium]